MHGCHLIKCPMSNSIELKVSKEERVGDNNFGFKLNAKLSDVRGANARMNHSFQVVASGDGIIAEGETVDDGSYEGHFVLPLQRAVRKTIRFIVNDGTSVIFKDVDIPSNPFLRQEALAEASAKQAERERYFESIASILNGKRCVEDGESLTLRSEIHDVTGIMSVSRGGRLTIPAGAVLRFAPNAGIYARGVLRIEGSPDQKVLLHAIERGKGFWKGISMFGAMGSVIRSAVIEGCRRNEGDFDNDKLWWRKGGGVTLIRASDDVELIDLTITGCEAFEGGGIYLCDAYPTMSGLNISGNRAEYGGGIFIKNTAWMHMKQGEVIPKVKIVNSVITRNVAGKNGGGIFAMDLPIQLEHTVVTNNSAEIGGGLYVYDYSGAARKRLLQELEQIRLYHYVDHPAWYSGRLKSEPKRRPLNQIPAPPADKHYGADARMRLTLDGCEISANKASVGDQVFISWGAVASGSRNKIARVHCEASGYRPKL